MLYSTAMLAALVIDVVIGWPQWLFRIVGHPVTWIGALISALERTFNKPHWWPASRRLLGLASLVITLMACIVPAAVLQFLLPDQAGGIAVAIAAWPLVAARSLHQHVAAVARPLVAGDLAEARRAVSMIVGRDTTNLDAAAVARAAMESLAENTSDGVVAPLFWGVLLGLPGIWAYKAINTLDSMIGHRTARYEDFGWASAKIDDYANYIPARLTAVVIAVVSGRPRDAFGTVVRDATKHRSPNAGFPEAALAGALGVRLSGPRIYATGTVNEPWLNGRARDPVSEDVWGGLRIYERTVLAIALVLCVFALT